MSDSSKGTAVVTGASRGIGAVYADRLAKRGYDLILVARDPARLETVSARLTRETGRSVTPLPADLNNKVDIANVEKTLRNDPIITMLVNNAGTASIAPLLNADVEKMAEMIALNITALTRLTYAVAPAFVERGAGTIINIASVVGVSPETLKARSARRRLSYARMPHSAPGEVGSQPYDESASPRASDRSSLCVPHVDPEAGILPDTRAFQPAFPRPNITSRRERAPGLA